MERQNFIQKINPKILAVVLLFFIVFIIMALLSLFKSPKTSNKNAPEVFPTPTLVPIQIPEGAQIPTPVIKTAPNVLINRLGDVTFGIINKTFPKKVKLYTFTPTAIETVNAQTIARSLLFATPGKQLSTNDGQAISFQEGPKSLIFYLGKGNIQYFSGAQVGVRTVGSEKDVIDSAQAFLKTFDSYAQNLSANPSLISYLVGSGNTRLVSRFEDADYYDVPFSQKINDLTLYVQLANPARAHVLVNKSKQITKATLNTPDILTAVKDVGIISIDDAKNKIIDNEGTIVSYGAGDQFETTLPVPDRTIFVSVELGYLNDNINYTLYPIYIFSGTAFTENQEEKIVVYLPALK